MNPIRVVIVDDEAVSRAGLRAILKDEADVEVVGECGSGGQAVELIEEAEPDIVFLDIRMPDMDGFGVLERIGAEQRPVIVFTTAYDEYAVEAFDVRATDYVLKPFGERRVKEALKRARVEVGRKRSELQQSQAQAERGAPLAEDEHPETDVSGDQGYPPYLAVKARERVCLVPVTEVDWIEADGDHVKVHVGSTCYRVRERLRDVEERLDPRRFVRIHRSSVVQLSRIKELQPFFHGDYVVVLRDGTKLRLTRSRRDAVERLLKYRL
ncbi:MAG: LytTR family DNA-binding domain-containing protein [Gemmatimonadales bacterium]|jgi:two-component system LytT family response regulator